MASRGKLLDDPPETGGRLTEALRRARLESAERTSVVVDLRDAELARLELLNEALDPLFRDVPPSIDLFDRAISKGETPRLWIDAVAHVVMGRDKRLYRFLQDSRAGRRILHESADPNEIVTAVTRYVARRMIERERALAGAPVPDWDRPAAGERRGFWRGFWRGLGRVLAWLLMVAALFAAAVWLLATY